MSLGRKTVFAVTLLLFTFYLLSLRSAKAQVPSPAPVPCGSTGNPEFNSLRPYQASPCQSELAPSAAFCGNNLTLHDTITEKYPGNGTCVTSGNKVTCTYNETVNESVTINLSGANLPFMGNTEDVPNSQPATGTPLTDAEKTNGYVSWYLNGVTNRAEDGSLDPVTADYNNVNFSGPINKLLPSAILDSQRIQTINNATAVSGCIKRNPNACNQKVCAANGTSYCCESQDACDQLQNTASTNHNQIVVCADKKYWLFGPVTPKACYQGDGTPASGEYRLSNWKENDLGIARDLTKVLGRFLKMIPGISQTEIANAIYSAWDKRIPPLPWADQDEKPFASEILYQKAYNEWKGKSCVIFLNRLFCLDWDPTNILVNSEWSELYPYIPLSSTEDLKGNIKVDSVSSATDNSKDTSVTSVTFSNQTPADLFFAHMTEAGEQATLLQSTYVAKGQDAAGAPTDVSSSTSCNTVEVRSNKGDSLFAKSITGNLKYDAKFTCQFDPICTGKDCKKPKEPQTCTKDVYISLSTSGSIPKVDDIWSRLVSGPAAIFKRIFPKTNTEGSVGKIMDIPGSTNITYSGGATSGNADLKFPHIGGISEYFLKGIQTALRPKGYGDLITFAPNSPTINSSVDCDKSVPDVSLPKTINKQNMYQLALNNVSGQPGNHVLDCYNDVVKRSLAAGINPGFTLFLWLNESNASNYSLTNLDFGINSASVVGFSAQIQRFLNLPTAYKSQFPQCFGKGNDTEAFFAIFLTGGCSSGAGKPYIDLFDGGWNWVSQCPIIKYPFKSTCY